MSEAKSVKSTDTDTTPIGVPSPYHFTSQTVFPIDNEPLAICIADDKFLVATMGHYVEVRNLEKKGEIDHTFCTVDLVKQMIYSEFGTYVATLEVKTSRQNLTTRIRTYLNWQVNTKGPMRARIAGRVTPSSQCGVGQLEMVELPLSKQACFIACCKSTGNLAVSCGCSVNIFYLCLKTHDISKLEFHDWDHLVEVYLSFPIKEVALCEDYLACTSANDVQVLELRHSCETDHSLLPHVLPPTTSTATKSKKNSSDNEEVGIAFDGAAQATEDEYFISWNDCSNSSGSSLEAFAPDLTEKLHPASWPLTVLLPSLSQQSIYVDQSNHSKEYIGPMHFFPGHPVKLEYGADILNVSGHSPPTHQFQTICLLYRRFPVPLPNNSNLQFCLHSLQFMPFYLPDQDHEDQPLSCICDTNPLHSNHRHHLRRLEVMFSGQRNGFIYDLLSTVKLVTEFTFFSDTHYVTVENSIFHAVTLTRITTYSIGKWERTFQFFNQSISGYPKKKICDLHQQQTVALGVHPFVNVHLVACGNNQLILLTNFAADSISSDSNVGWTAYALHCPNPEEFYRDLLNYSSDIMDESTGGVDIRFLYEAHAAMATQVLVHRPPPSSRLAICFQDVCCRLANYHLTSTAGDLSDAQFFYTMSSHGMDAIASMILSAKSEAHQADKFWKRKVDILSSLFIKTSFTKHEIISEQTGDQLLQALASTEEFPLFFLKGDISGYNAAKALEHIHSRLNSSEKFADEDMVAAFVLYAQLGLMDQLKHRLSILEKETLPKIAVAHPAVWLLQSEPDLMCSALFQSIQKLDAGLFVKLFLQFLRHGLVTTSLVSVLCNTDWEELGLAPRTDATLALFLEEYLIDDKVAIQDRSQAVIALSSLYLKFLANLDPKSSLEPRKKSSKLFGRREAWLNRISPFAGHTMFDPCIKTKEEVDEETLCWCVICNDCLLRLQSLLCSTLASWQVKTTVAISISAAVSLRGSSSLKLLCSQNPVDGARILIESGNTLAFMDYCQERISTNSSQWRQLLVLLMDQVESQDLSDDARVSISNLLDGVASQLAELLSPVEFVSILPVDQGSRYEADVKRCIAKFQATNLRNIIIAKGQELKSIV